RKRQKSLLIRERSCLEWQMIQASLMLNLVFLEGTTYRTTTTMKMPNQRRRRSIPRYSSKYQTLKIQAPTVLLRASALSPEILPFIQGTFALFVRLTGKSCGTISMWLSFREMVTGTFRA